MAVTNSTSIRPRILVADDNQNIRDKVVQLLSADFDVVGTASDGIGAYEAAQILLPDVIVLDISMPRLSGIEAVTKIKGAQNETRIVFLTVHDDPDFVRAAIKIGGSGYVLKSRMATELLVAIRSAMDGKVFISPEVVMNGENSNTS